MQKDRTWVEISTGAIEKNIRGYKKLLPKETALMAVVKANAYGHGLLLSAEAAIKSGADYLAVFTMDDALLLRKQFPEEAILVLKQIEKDELDLALKNSIDITVSSISMLKIIVSYPKAGDLLINLKIDTGLSRQGFLASELNQVIKIIKNVPEINISSLYTHLIGAENKKFDVHTNSQILEIRRWQKVFNEEGYYPLVHSSATSGFLMNQDLCFDVVRVGIGMYGLWPSDEVRKKTENKLKLYPALSWKTKISEIKEITTGKVVAYDATFVAKKNMKIAVLPIGYFDGLPRELSNKGYMLCGGIKCAILGRVMMNMCVIDVSDVKNPKPGDEVVIIGTQKAATISAEEIASWARTINYEIVTRINGDIARVAIR